MRTCMHTVQQGTCSRESRLAALLYSMPKPKRLLLTDLRVWDLPREFYSGWEVGAQGAEVR